VLEWMEAYLGSLGLAQGHATLAAHVVLLGAMGVLAWVADLVAKRLLVRTVHYVVSRSQTDWDDVLAARGVFDQVAQVAPALVIYLFAPLFGAGAGWVQRLAIVYMIIVILRALHRVVDGVQDLYQRTEVAREKPIRGYLQVGQIVLWLVGGIFVLSTLLERDPWGLLTGLGAMSAVLLLVFRDSILGFVASVQLASNNMVRIGDWVEIPAYGADGDVLDISLHTVKVQNWDKTISTVPTHALVTGSFKNWRGMSESGGRRIKRAVHVDIGTIRFCDNEMLDRFERYAPIAEYIRGKRSEIGSADASDEAAPINRRRLTNVGTYRAYIEAYLRGRSELHPDMTFLVRQLAPTERGLPIEIYVFSRIQAWARYEALQADLFDHILAAAPEFDLRVYQRPSSHDVSTLASPALLVGD